MFGGSCTFSPQEAPAFWSNRTPREAAFSIQTNHPPGFPGVQQKLLRNWEEERDTENEQDKMSLGQDLQKFPGLQKSVWSGLCPLLLPAFHPHSSPAPASQSSPRPSPSFCSASALAHTQPLLPLSLTISSCPSPSTPNYPQTQSKERLRTMVLYS